MVKFYTQCLLALASVAAITFAAKQPQTLRVPSLGILSIDPMLVTEMTLAQGRGPVNIEINFQNTTITGLKDSVVIKASNELLAGGTTMYCDFVIPRFSMLSQYNIKGRVLLLPIHGQGQSNITMYQLKAKYIVKSDIIKKKNGQEYIKVNSVDLKLAPGKSFINFENLFDGDKRLSDQMNVILSENANDIVNELRPSIEDTFAEIGRQVATKLFQNVPYKTIFPLEEEKSEE